jgi:hypothetical protein
MALLENVAIRKTRYMKTLELYNEAFGSITPKDIWADYMDTSNIPMDELQVHYIIIIIINADGFFLTSNEWFCKEREREREREMMITFGTTYSVPNVIKMYRNMMKLLVNSI